MSSPHTNAIAGPSSQPFFPIPFRLDTRRESKRVSTPSPRRPIPNLRSSTPIRPPSRARSSSTYSAITQVDEDAAQLDARRADSVRKMVDIWNSLGSRYSTKAHENDEIMIDTGELVADRGTIKRMIPVRDIGEDSSEEDEDEDTEVMTVISETVDSDEDELGRWDVDPQTRILPARRVDSELDQRELRQFLLEEEERKEMDLNEDEEEMDADEEEGWTEDDQSDNDEGASQSDYPEVGQEFSEDSEEDSEDELLAVDHEASRVTPVPSRTRHNMIEVVIPVRSLSQSRRRTISASPSPPPSPQKPVSPIIAPPIPTLDDLFTPPPERPPPITLLPSVPPPTIRKITKPSFTPREFSTEIPSFTTAEKGKGRMTSETPLAKKAAPSLEPIANPEDVDPPSDIERYHPDILHLSRASVGFCRTCRQSSDPLRRDRSYYCKGRGKAISCTFAKELGEELVYAVNRDSMARVRARKRAAREASRSSATPGIGISESETGVVPSTSEKKKARPRRASAAHMLRSKTPVKESIIEEETSPAARLRELKEKRLQRARRAKTEQTPQVPLQDTPRSKSEDTPKSSPLVAPVEMAPTQSMDSDPETWMLQVILPSLPREMRDLTQDPFEIPPSPPPTRRPENKRPVKSVGSSSDAEERSPRSLPRPGSVRLTISSAPKLPIPSPPVNISKPAIVVSDKRSARKRIMTPVSVSPAPDTLSSLRPDRSTPPSSPPFSSPPSHSTAQFSHPTPSPTASAEPDASGPSHLWPPTSPTRRRILPLPRGSHYAIHPTPPPSTDSRTSSLSSDRMPFDRPRSILRGSSSAPYSAKRARFSLQPSSPGVDLSDIFAQSDNESQDFDAEWQSSQDTEEGSDGPSSPFFSTELSVRAADAGFQLGPGHTGRITPGMMQALYPKYGKDLHAVSSPIRDDRSESSPKSTPTALKPYTLPTPPRISTPSRSARSPSKAGSTAGLMLPPPVPPKRLSSVSSSTPGPSTPGRSSSDPTPPAELLRTPPAPKRRPLPTIIRTEPKPFTFKTTLPARVIHLQSQSRSRSRSVSAVPSSRGSSVGLGEEIRNVPSSTPRKRHRDRSEREIARLARELGDDAGLEWGLDEDVGPDLAREGREGTVFMYSI